MSSESESCAANHDAISWSGAKIAPSMVLGMPEQFDREKFKSLVLYVSAACARAKLGAVKMNKVLYFSDMLRYAQTGKSITGATYRKQTYGPVCEQLGSALAELRRDGEIEILESDYFGFRKKEFIAKRAPETKLLAPEERALVDEIVQFVCFQNSAKTISEFSHNRAWESVGFGAEIPYVSAFSIFPTSVSREAFDWAETEAHSIAQARSNKDALRDTDFAAFRGRISST